ncbi:SPOR domain-containing protein [Bowmanella denitrificans]|uniref:SPOR domain-containing protein n=1 Tax=Bowmanella denitrificans TaxID=366582 RepID=UPI000C9D16C5|nr:SPOR domain-containing protein [Bowmanella denitrificans]
MKIRPNNLSLLPLVGIFTLMACQSAPSPHPDDANAEQEQLKAELAILKQKQQKYDAVVDEWQDMREGLQRLLVVEEELGLLIEQLDRMTMSEDNQAAKPRSEPVQVAAQKTSDQQALEQRAPQSESAESSSAIPTAEKFRLESDLTPQYALQLTAVTSPSRLKTLWQDLRNKHPMLLAEMPANYEHVKVKNTDYYRLKVGAFTTEQAATKHCTALKAQGLSCIVNQYHAAPLTGLEQ